LPLNLTEGDIICILSQYGEIDDINLVRDGDSGKSRGFAFVKYDDARSCILAVDNLTGSQILGRTMRVDHVENYRLPKNLQTKEQQNENDVDGEEEGSSSSSACGVTTAGHAYEDQELANSYNIQSGQDLFAAPQKDDRMDDDRVMSSVGGGGDDTLKDIKERKRRKELRAGEDTLKDDKEERKRRKELRAKKRKEKEEHARRKEERKRRKHGDDR
jgi:RNA-binding motif X-linked protein 2